MKGKSRTDLVSLYKPDINIASLYTSFHGKTAKDNRELLNIIRTTKPNKCLNPKSYFIFWNKHGEKIRDLLNEGECLRVLPLDFIELGLDSILPHLGISDNLMSNYYSVLLRYPDFFSLNRAKQDFIQISPLENEKCLGYLTLTGLLKDDNHSLLSYNERYRLCATYLLARLGYSFEDIYNTKERRI